MTGTWKRARELAQFYWAQRVQGFSIADEPFLDDEATVALRDYLARSGFYLEFGSGGSTVLASRLGLETISVDNDAYFLRAVSRKLAAGHRVTQIHADIGLTVEWGYPAFKRPTPARLARWRRYIALPFARIAERNRFPDFVLVDGRFRVACALESARQAQLAGQATTIMVDDYGLRDQYAPLEKHLGAPRRVGRAALFEIAPDGPPPAVPLHAIDEAMLDYR